MFTYTQAVNIYKWEENQYFYQCGIAAETDNTTSAEGHIHMLHKNGCQKNNSVGLFWEKGILTRGQETIIHKDSAKTDIAWDLKKKTQKTTQTTRHLESTCFTLNPCFYYPVRTYTWFCQKPCYACTIFLDLFCCLVKVSEFAANSTPEAQMGIKSILSPSIRFHIMFSTIFKLYNLSSRMICLFPLGDCFIYTQNPNSSVHILYRRLEVVIKRGALCSHLFVSFFQQREKNCQNAVW